MPVFNKKMPLLLRGVFLPLKLSKRQNYSRLTRQPLPDNRVAAVVLNPVEQHGDLFVIKPIDFAQEMDKKQAFTITKQAMMPKNTFCFLLTWACLPMLWADSTGVGLKLGVLPSIYYTPETRIAVGAFGYTYFRATPNDTISRKSKTQTYVTYTQNRQFAVENDYQIFLNHGKTYLKGQIDFFNFPENFYGIGNNTAVSDRKTIEYKFFKLYHKTLRKIHKNNYLGFIVDYQRQWDLNQKLMDDDSDRMISGYNGFTGAGLGAIFLVDKRDNILNPAQGQ
jgi:hypothetical protein